MGVMDSDLDHAVTFYGPGDPCSDFNGSDSGETCLDCGRWLWEHVRQRWCETCGIHIPIEAGEIGPWCENHERRDR